MENEIESNETESNMGGSLANLDRNTSDNVVNMGNDGHFCVSGRRVSGHKVWQDESGE